MTDRLAATALILVAASALTVLLATPKAKNPGPTSVVPLTIPTPLNPQIAVSPDPGAIAAGAKLSRHEPPPVDALRGNAQLQMEYDQQAQVGQYVTPPSVSVPH